MTADERAFLEAGLVVGLILGLVIGLILGSCRTPPPDDWRPS
jgi:hypothetical protein